MPHSHSGFEDNPLNRDTEANSQPVPHPKHSRKELPAGYRQGIITAITVILGFSLLFLRFWSFEAEGEWAISSAIAAILLFIAITLQIFSLWRALQVSDDDEIEYGKTLRWFLASTIVLLLSVLIAVLAFSGLLTL